MKIWVRQLPDDVTAVEVHGEVYPNSSAQLQETMTRLLDEGRLRLLLSIDGVQAVHDTIVGGIVRTLKKMAQKRRGHLAILQTGPAISLEDLAQHPHLTDHYTIVASREEALAILATPPGA